MRAGSASGRRSPADGERRLISAIAPSPGRRSASSKRPIRRTPARTPPARSSRAAAAPASSVARATSSPSRRSSRVPGGGDAAGGVQEHGLALRPVLLAREDPADLRRVLLRAAAGERRRVGRLDPELGRVDDAVADVAVDDLGRPGSGRTARARRSRRSRGRRTRGASRAARAPRRSSARATPSRRRRRPRARPAGFVSGPRTLKIVRVPSSRRTGAAWRIAGWCDGANMKPKPRRSIDSAIRSGGCSSVNPSASSTSAEPDAELTARLPCFATAAPAAAATIAAAVEMFSVRPPSPPVPTTSTTSSRSGRTGEHVLAHRLRAARDLVRRLALRPQGDEEPGDLRLRRLAGHDPGHHLARLLARQVAAVGHLGDRAGDHDRKFRAIAGPSGVRTLSGWNWTPSIGSVTWRTPITSPSGVREVTSRSSGTVVAASEW